MRISQETLRWILLSLVGIVTVGAVLVWGRTHFDLLLILPLGILALFQAIVNYRTLYYVLFLAVPASLHLEMGGNSLDTSEPFMLFFLGIFLLNILSGKQFSWNKKIHPLFIFIFILIFWTLLTSITSVYPLRSFKYLLSKLWYLAPFIYIGDKLIESPKQIKTLFWCFLIPLTVFSIFTTLKHGIVYQFSFDGAFDAPYPFFTNHVIYGCVLVQFLPFVWNAMSWYEKDSLPYYVLQVSMGVLLVGTALTFGRMAWICAIALPIIYFAIKRKLFDKIVYAGLVMATIIVFYLVQNNNYYKYAPDFNSTVFHEGDFEAHLTATFEGSDVSGVERFYRWVAAKNMVGTRPFLGFGPSTFSQVYKHFADDAFSTWVSENNEQSTTHNYFLMTCAEQGFPGLFIFVGLLFFMILLGYRIYHQSQNPFHQGILLCTIASLCVITMHSTLNELIEVDKNGSLFWFSMLLIYKMDIWEKKEMSVESLAS